MYSTLIIKVICMKYVVWIFWIKIDLEWLND